jgi:hypothetical protein
VRLEVAHSLPPDVEQIQQAGFLNGQSSEKRNPEFIFLHFPVFNSTLPKSRNCVVLFSL